MKFGGIEWVATAALVAIVGIFAFVQLSQFSSTPCTPCTCTPDEMRIAPASGVDGSALRGVVR